MGAGFPGGRKAKGMASYGKNGNYVRVETDKGRIGIEPAYGYGGQKGSTPAGPMDFDHVPQQQLQIEGQVEAILSGAAAGGLTALVFRLIVGPSLPPINVT